MSYLAKPAFEYALPNELDLNKIPQTTGVADLDRRGYLGTSFPMTRSDVA